MFAFEIFCLRMVKSALMIDTCDRLQFQTEQIYSGNMTSGAIIPGAVK